VTRAGSGVGNILWTHDFLHALIHRQSRHCLLSAQRYIYYKILQRLLQCSSNDLQQRRHCRSSADRIIANDRMIVYNSAPAIQNTAVYYCALRCKTSYMLYSSSVSDVTVQPSQTPTKLYRTMDYGTLTKTLMIDRPPSPTTRTFSDLSVHISRRKHGTFSKMHHTSPIGCNYWQQYRFYISYHIVYTARRVCIA